MRQHTEILDDGTLDYDETFFSQIEADSLFEELRTATPWQQERSRLGPFPRLTAWYADAELTYSYSGVTHEALPWTPHLLEVRRRAETAAATPFNSVLLNFYRDGQDSIGYHSDAEPELGANPVIASISLGSVRQFVLKHVKTGEKLKFDLASGSLMVMGGSCQHHWVHCVPKTKAAVGPRINLTFRNIVAY
ncbi:MAG: alpha-ketoglutarate-dependent dioxygenase AlkB [Gemmataceae bacterium]|nr:alpha-ketoglutarate-dependent dioxygenase AlkB [Gemmataceae bacterium]